MAVDAKEMPVGALSNCHMLSFLHVARLAGFTLAAYRDHAEGTMEEIAPGRRAITKVSSILKSNGQARPQTIRNWTACTIKPTCASSRIP
jgi:organic hydroperoxide reductase OsmC/OhrA